MSDQIARKAWSKRQGERLRTVLLYNDRYYYVTMKAPIHPGEILLEEYLVPLKVSQNALARALNVTPKTVSEIVLRKRGVSPEMSIRLGTFFGQSPRFWLKLQSEHDFRVALRQQRKLTSKISTLKELAAA